MAPVYEKYQHIKREFNTCTTSKTLTVLKECKLPFWKQWKRLKGLMTVQNMYIIQDIGNQGRYVALGTGLLKKGKAYLFYHIAKNQKPCQECNKTDDWEIANSLQGFEGYPRNQFNALSVPAEATVALGKTEVLTPRLTTPINIPINQTTNVIYYLWADSRRTVAWSNDQLRIYVEKTIQIIYPDIKEKSRKQAAVELVATRHVTRIALIARMTMDQPWTMTLLVNKPGPYTLAWFKYPKGRQSYEPPEQFLQLIRPKRLTRFLFQIEKDVGVLIKEPYFSGGEVLLPMGSRAITIEGKVVSWTKDSTTYRENVYEYKEDHYIITTKGRIFWLKNKTVKTLRDMELIDRYEILVELTQASVTNQILNEKIAQFKPWEGRRRLGSTLIINSKNIMAKYRCVKNNDVIVFLNRTLHFEQRPYIPIIKIKDLRKPIALIRRSDKALTHWILHELKNASKWSPKTKERKVNSTSLFLKTLKIFVDKRTLTLKDIRKGYWFLLIARTYGLIKWTWVNSHIYKIDQDNQIIEGLTFSNPPEISDFIWKGKLYSYSPYGNEVTPLHNITKLKSFKYDVAQKKRLETRKERMGFTPWQTMDFTALQTARIIELIVKHTRKLSNRVEIGQQEREKLRQKQKALEGQWLRKEKNQTDSLERLTKEITQLSQQQKNLEEQFDDLNKNVTVRLKEELTTLVRDLVTTEIHSKLDDIARKVYSLNRENRDRFRRMILEETEKLRQLVVVMNQTVNIRLKNLKLQTGNNSVEIHSLSKVVKEMNQTTTILIKNWSEKVLNNSKRITIESTSLNKEIEKVSRELNARINLNQKEIERLKTELTAIALLLNSTKRELELRIQNVSIALKALDVRTNERIKNLTLLLEKTDSQLRREIGLTQEQLELKIRRLRAYTDQVTTSMKEDIRRNRQRGEELTNSLRLIEDNFEDMKKDLNNWKVITKGLGSRLNTVEKKVTGLYKITDKLRTDVTTLSKRTVLSSENWLHKLGVGLKELFNGGKKGVVDVIDAILQLCDIF